MNIIRSLIRISTLILICSYSAAIYSASEYVDVGNERISIPLPKGFKDAKSNSPTLFSKGSLFVVNEYQLLMLLVEPKAIADSNNGLENITLRRYAIITTPQPDSTIVSEIEFLHFQNSMISGIGTLNDPKIKDEVNSSVSVKNSGTKYGNELQGKVVSNSKYHTTILKVTTLIKDSKSINVLGLSSALLIRGKIIIINMYYNPPSKNDKISAEKLNNDWIKSILDAN